MYDSVISAPTGIDTFVTELQKARADIDTMMQRLQTERGKLLAVSDGEMFVAFNDAERLWNQTGTAQAQMVNAVATRSEEYRTNMLHIDKRGAAEFGA